MKAKDYLLQVSKLDKLIENKLIEKEQWMAIAMSTTTASDGGDRVQTSGSQQKMADAVCRYVEIEQQIDKCIDELVDAKQGVISTIETLPAIEYDILHKVYIQYKTLDDVASIYKKTYSWVTTVHGRGLKHVQHVLDERKAK